MEDGNSEAGSNWGQPGKVARPTIPTALVVARPPHIRAHARSSILEAFRSPQTSDLNIRSASRILQRPRTPPPLANSHSRRATDIMNHSHPGHHPCLREPTRRSPRTPEPPEQHPIFILETTLGRSFPDAGASGAALPLLNPERMQS